MIKTYKISYTQPIPDKSLEWIPHISFCSIKCDYESTTNIVDGLLDILNEGSTIYIDDGNNIRHITRQRMIINQHLLNKENMVELAGASGMQEGSIPSSAPLKENEDD